VEPSIPTALLNAEVVVGAEERTTLWTNVLLNYPDVVIAPNNRIRDWAIRLAIVVISSRAEKEFKIEYRNTIDPNI
jgi:hypothetical protein